MASLHEVQRSLRDWITAPEGVAARIEERDSALPHDQRGAARRELTDLVRGDAALDAIGRLEIYANAYFYRIASVLESDYSALAAGLGKSLFNDVVTSYLLVHPSGVASLRWVGEALPLFLARHEAMQGIRERAPWAADLALFERIRGDLFDSIDRSPLDRTQLAARPPEAFAAIRLELLPQVCVQEFTYPVHTLWREAEPEAEPFGIVSPEEVCVIVWRRDEVVRHRVLGEDEALALRMLIEGTSFGTLCEWVGERWGDDEGSVLAAGWLEQWLADGILAATA